MSATPEQEAAFQNFCEQVSGAVIHMADQAERLGFAPALTLTAVLGGVAALSRAAGLKRENVVAALNSALDDVQ